ncbi:MAG: WG repeat-containing protein [Clostridiales bacterium]|nr:WG repeat-containing protein [Clostridiales bacterium]
MTSKTNLAMKKIEKSFYLAITILIVLSLVSCSQETADKPLLSEKPLELDINNEISDISNGWVMDVSGMFSYKEYYPINGIELYFEPLIGCPDNMVLYKGEVDGKEMYGYMDTDFNVLSEPINEMPMIFQYGYANLRTNYQNKIMDKTFNVINDRGDSAIIQGDSVLYVDWNYWPIDKPRIISGIDRDSFLVPYTVTHNIETGEQLPIPHFTGFKTISDAYDETGSADECYVIPPIFIVVNSFSDGLAPIIHNDGFAFINEQGKIVIDNGYDSLYQEFIDGVALVSIHEGIRDGEVVDGICIIDKEGNELTDFYMYMLGFQDGFAVCCIKGGQWTYFDTKGKRINEVDYFEANSFSEGIGRVRFQDGFTFIDTNGNRISGSLYDEAKDFGDGKAAVKVGDMWGYIGKDGVYSIKPQYRFASSFSNGYALIKDHLDTPGVIIDEMENRYLEELQITRLTKFNDDGYAIALTNRIVNGVMESTYYMIHSENYDR